MRPGLAPPTSHPRPRTLTAWACSLRLVLPPPRTDWYAALAVVFLILTFIIILFFWFARKAIKRLIAIVQECTKVFKAMAAIVLWPVFIQLPFMLGVYVGLAPFETARCPRRCCPAATRGVPGLARQACAARPSKLAPRRLR